MRDAALAGDDFAIASFFTEEYALNAAIAAYPKPYVALIDGFCMGGGIGLSVHGAIRVATERAQFAMPETAIGLFPDVGASYVLPRLPGWIGMWMGLTGIRLTGADAVHAGIATHFVPSEKLPRLSDAIAQDGVAAVGAFACALPAFSLQNQRSAIDRCFGGDGIDEIIIALRAETTEWARTTLEHLGQMSPSSLRWSLDIIRAGADRELAECLAAELELVKRVVHHPDLAEGVRAMVIDKDRKPKWQKLATA